MLKDLMTSRRFAPLFLTQFFSALNDNFLKQSLVLLCLFKIGGAEGATLGTIAGAVLIAPFFILSAFAGELADKYDKATLARRYKFVEIFAAAFAAGGFALQSVPLLMIALGLYGSIAALFGPIKYGILPDQLKTEELAGGNALIESGTFLAILAGPVAAGWAAARDQPPTFVVVLIMAIAIACWLSARFIPSAPSSAPGLVITRNPWTSTFALIRETRTDEQIWRRHADRFLVLARGRRHVVAAASCRHASHRRHGERQHALHAGIRDRRRDRLVVGRAPQSCQAQSGAGAAGRRRHGALQPRARCKSTRGGQGP